MIISASHVLDFVDMHSIVKVVDMEGNDAFPADFERIIDLVSEGQVCGHKRGSVLKFLELLVPISETEPKRRQIETSASINARTNIGAYRQHLDGASVWALCLSRVFDGVGA